MVVMLALSAAGAFLTFEQVNSSFVNDIEIQNIISAIIPAVYLSNLSAILSI